MNSRKPKFLITQTLLSSWQYAIASGDMKEFAETLQRKKKPPTKAMLDGQRFENVVESVATGITIEPDHEWYRPVTEIANIVKDGQYQVKLSRGLTIDGITFVCYGILDFLKCGVIYDTKFSKTYHVGKYLDSPQHPMYFYLCPEAYKFEYIISDGKWVYREIYRPDDVEPIERTIKHFMDFLDSLGLVNTYCENWKSKY